MEQERPQKSGNKAAINREKCKPDGCLKCMIACDIAEAISKADDGFPLVNLDECCGCGSCKEECPQEAIKVFYLEGTQPDPPRKKFAVW